MLHMRGPLGEKKGWWRHNFCHQCCLPIGCNHLYVMFVFLAKGLLQGPWPGRPRKKKINSDRLRRALLVYSFFMFHVICQKCIPFLSKKMHLVPLDFVQKLLSFWNPSNSHPTKKDEAQILKRQQTGNGIFTCTLPPWASWSMHDWTIHVDAIATRGRINSSVLSTDETELVLELL